MKLSEVHAMSDEDLILLRAGINTVLSERQSQKDNFSNLVIQKLSIRAVNLINDHEITSIEQLRAIGLKKIKKWRGVGELTLNEIRKFLNEH